MSIVMDDILRIAKEQQEAYFTAYQTGFQAGMLAGIAEAQKIIDKTFAPKIADDVQ